MKPLFTFHRSSNPVVCSTIVMMLAGTHLIAQVRGELISETLIEVFDRERIEEVYQEFGLPEVFCPIDYDVELYKIVYRTAAATGDSTTLASGLLTVPVSTTCDFPLSVFNHGTLLYDEELSEGQASSQQHLIGIPFAANGYVSLLPDLLGYGATPVELPHPYLHSASEASAVIDMLRAARTFCQERGTLLNDQLFLLGYSQGGHTTMAAHRELESAHAEEFSVTASAPCSGAYDLSGIARDSMLYSDRFSIGLFLAFTLQSYQFVYEDLYGDLSEAIMPPYDDQMLRMLDRAMPESDLEDSLRSPAYEMFQPLYFEEVVSDEVHPLNVALRANDVYDWVPRAPVRFVYCEGDDRVPFAQTLFTQAHMTGLGATQVTTVSAGAENDHDACTFPAILSSKLWFDTYRIGCSVAGEAIAEAAAPRLYPNPFRENIQLEYPDGQSASFNRLTVYDLAGRMLLSTPLVGEKRLEVPANSLAPGAYIFELSGRNGAVRQLMVKQ